MKRFLVFCLAMHVGVPPIWAHLKAYFHYAIFNIPEKSPYVETYLSINGTSVIYRPNTAGKNQASVEIILLLKQNEKIISYKKYNLLSPEYFPSDSLFKDFLDQQRLSLPGNGTFELELQMKDNFSPERPYVLSQILDVQFDNKTIQFSDILPLSSITKSEDKTSPLYKNGYILLPYLPGFYDDHIETFAFYVEIYNTSHILGEGEKYLVKYFLTDEQGNPVAMFHSFSKQEAKPVNVILGSFNIKTLATGNYFFVVEARDKENKLLVQKRLFFQRKNSNHLMDPYPDLSQVNITQTFTGKLTRDSLSYFISALLPIAEEGEFSLAAELLKEKDIEKMRKYFYAFWYHRNADNPESAWLAYKKQLDYVNKTFSTKIKKGYETDRGRVYLRYGPPNTIADFPREPSSYPYQIWHYYKIDKYTNRKFVFYNTDLSSNDYELLHSDMLGEINTPNWEKILQKRTETFYDPYQEEGVKHYGGNSEQFFKNPR